MHFFVLLLCILFTFQFVPVHTKIEVFQHFRELEKFNVTSILFWNLISLTEIT